MNARRGSYAAGTSVLLFLLSFSLLARPASAALGLLNAVDHNATTTANVPVTVDVLAGDSCVLNGLPCVGGMKVVSVGPSSHGDPVTPVINPDYTVTYTPTLGYVGSDSFTYTAHDMLDLLSGTGTVHVTVNQRTSSISISLSATSVVEGGSVTFTATVTDASRGTPSTPTGTVSWSAGGVGGSFIASPCSLSSLTSSQSRCSTTYVAPATAGTATISASYSADSVHTASSASSSLTVNPPPPHPTSTTVSPNPSSVTGGTSITFTANVADAGASPSSPSGTVTWSDGGQEALSPSARAVSLS